MKEQYQMIPDTPSNKVLTTLPHFLAVVVALTNGRPWYATLICASTLCSVLWHADGDSPGRLWTLDHAVAAAWSVTDAWLWPPSILLNAVVTATCPGIARSSTDGWSHADWHLLSVTKAIVVAAAM